MQYTDTVIVGTDGLPYHSENNRYVITNANPEYERTRKTPGKGDTDDCSNH
jgi:hypothetical protein